MPPCRRPPCAGRQHLAVQAQHVPVQRVERPHAARWGSGGRPPAAAAGRRTGRGCPGRSRRRGRRRAASSSAFMVAGSGIDECRENTHRHFTGTGGAGQRVTAVCIMFGGGAMGDERRAAVLYDGHCALVPQVGRASPAARLARRAALTSTPATTTICRPVRSRSTRRGCCRKCTSSRRTASGSTTASRPSAGWPGDCRCLWPLAPFLYLPGVPAWASACTSGSPATASAWCRATAASARCARPYEVTSAP